MKIVKKQRLFDTPRRKHKTFFYKIKVSKCQRDLENKVKVTKL